MNLDLRLMASFITAIAFEIFFPLVLGYLIHRRYGVRWRFFLYGALVFFLSQLITRIPAVQAASIFLAPSLQSSDWLLYGWYIVLALTAGLFEEVGRYLGYRYLVKEDKTWRVGLMFGAGHGGLESMVLIGGLVLLSFIGIIALNSANLESNLTPDQVAQIQLARQQVAALDWWTPLLGAYERFITIFFHIALSIVVLQTFLRNSWLWLVLAVAIHAAVDLAALLLAPRIGPLWTEAALTLVLPVSLGIIYYFRPRAETPAPEPVPAS